MAADGIVQVFPGIATNRGAIKNALTLAASTLSTPGIGCQILVSVSGTVVLTLQGGGTLTVNPITSQDNFYPCAIVSWTAGTATVTTFWNCF